jgi:multiple sugar transport system permease protein
VGTPSGAERFSGGAGNDRDAAATVPALLLVLSITGSLPAFDQFCILTQGQPDNSTITMVMVIYREAFFRFDLGSAAALSVVVLIVLVALNALQLSILRRDRTASEPF